MTKRYDLEMIHDLLDHLPWEVRVAHFEQTTQPRMLHPEMIHQLSGYMQKYGTGPLPVVQVDPTAVEQEDDASRHVVSAANC